MPIHSTFTRKNTYITQSQNKTNLINVQMQPKRETTFILPCMLKYNDK